jgi:hypothetical protein
MNDGGYLLAGTSYSGANGEKSFLKNGHGDYWIIKIDVAGTTVWDGAYGGSSLDFLGAAIQTSDGGFIVGGYSRSGISGDKSQNNQGIVDYWIVKTDAAGVKQWDARYGGNGSDALDDIVETADGGYLLGGHSESRASGDKSEAGNGKYDFWIVKINSTGVKQWDVTLGGNKEENFAKMVKTEDGGYVLGGTTRSNKVGDVSKPSLGAQDYWIIKIDANGNKLWDNRFGGNSTDVMNTLIQTSDGGFLLGGNSESNASFDKSENSKGSADYWLVKTDANGEKQWDVTIGGGDLDICGFLSETSEGDFLIGGNSYSEISGDKTQASQGVSDYWIVKTDANGSVLWDVTFGASSYETARGIFKTADGGYILGGNSYSPIGGDKEADNEGTNDSPDFWVLKTGPEMEFQLVSNNTLKTMAESGIQEELKAEIFPNPFSDYTTIQFSTSKQNTHLKIDLLDLSGRKIKTIAEGNYDEGNHQLNFSAKDLPKGIYLLRLQMNSSFPTQKTNPGMVTKKLIIQ